MKITLVFALVLLTMCQAQLLPSNTSAPQPQPTTTASPEPTSQPTSQPEPTSQPTSQPEPEPLPPTSADCADLSFSCSDLRQAAISANGQENGGIGVPVWIAAVNRFGRVCCVEFTGTNANAQWLSSRVPAAVKAFTANGMSIPQLSLSTANLFTLSQPGNLFHAMQGSSPPNVATAYSGNPQQFGTSTDPMIGQVIGGHSYNGGGLALYRCSGTAAQVVGAIGVDGDTSCAAHAIAWRVRNLLNLDHVPSGVRTVSNNNSTGGATASDDNILYTGEEGAGGFAHARCTGGENDVTVRNALPATRACQ